MIKDAIGHKTMYMDAYVKQVDSVMCNLSYKINE